MVNQTEIVDNNRLHWEACMNVRRWYVFFGSSVTCFLGGVLFILFCRLYSKARRWVQKKCCPKTRQKHKTLFDQHNIEDTNVRSVESDYSSDTKQPEMRITLPLPAARQATTTNIISTFCNSVTNIVRISAFHLVSYQSRVGRLFIALLMVLSLCSFGIYVFEATVWPGEVEKCGHKGRRFRLFDFLVNIFFLIHFVVRFIAARDALIFWIDGFSVVDYFTVPPILIGFNINRTWLGFRFARSFRLINLAEVLHNLNIIKSASSLRLCYFCTLFLSIWFSGAGMLLLLENTGDLFGNNAYNVSAPISYPNALYFTVVTMATVGYGDITPQTQLGRIFICFFIFVALATFASAIPVIEESFFSVRKYSGNYLKPEDKSHIVVCGDITTDSVKTFLTDFLHEDRKRSDVEVVFINPSQPDLQLQSILSLHFSRVKYFQGTVMDHTDLQRVRISEADACLILTTPTVLDADQKDAANIMRVIAVKNYASHVRVIVQLLKTQNKAHLLNSPYWNWDAGDEIICFSELKLGFLAQSCLAPGISTLLTNLFSMHSESALKRARKSHKASQIKKGHIQKDRLTPSVQRKSAYLSNKTHYMAPALRHSVYQTFVESPQRKLKDNQKHVMSIEPFDVRNDAGPGDVLSEKNELTLQGNTEAKEWFSNYLHGLSMEIYSAPLSSAFEGYRFSKAAVICRQNLNLLLIAVTSSPPTTETDSQADSAHSYSYEDSCTENTNTNTTKAAYFLAINPSDESGIVMKNDTIGFFVCDSQQNADRATVYCAKCHGGQRFLTPVPINLCRCQQRHASGHLWKRKQATGHDDKKNKDQNDESGGHMPLEASRLTADNKATIRERWNSLLPQAQDGSTLPTRAPDLDVTGMYYYCTSRPFEDSHLLRTTTASWRSKTLLNHILVCLVTEEDSPLLGLQSFVMPLRASNIPAKNLKTIVIVANEGYLRREWPNLENFPNVYCLPGSPLCRYQLRAARIRFCSICVVLGSPVHARGDDRYMLDKEVILCSLNIRAMKFQPLPPESTLPKLFHRRFGYEIPIITELLTDANIHYLDPDDIETDDTNIPAPLTATFARGVAFTSSVLNVLASTAYFDGHAMTLIRHLISGGVTPAMEQWFAEGGRLNPYEHYVEDDTDSENEMRAKAINQSVRQMHIQLGSSEIRRRPRLEQLSVLDRRLRHSDPGKSSAFTTFGDMFCYAIEKRGILCLGIYRNRYMKKNDLNMTVTSTQNFRDDGDGTDEETRLQDYSRRRQKYQLQTIEEAEHSIEPITSTSRNECETDFAVVVNRYVITNPPNYFRLHRSDLVFCICPFQIN